jgi:hypothetical protein
VEESSLSFLLVVVVVDTSDTCGLLGGDGGFALRPTYLPPCIPSLRWTMDGMVR